MSNETKFGLTIAFLVSLVLGSYYGAYRTGRHLQYKQMAPIMADLSTQTYFDGYSDGKKQAELDCVIRETIR